MSACRERLETESVVTADLSARFAVATVQTETSSIDFGTAEARRHLVSGWSRDMTDGNNRSLVRSVGEQSTLRFFIFEPRTTAIRFRCRPRAGLTSISSLEIRLNGATAGSVELEPRLKTYELEVPADLLIGGENLLSFAYVFAGSPAQESTAEVVDLTSVGWFNLNIGGSQTPIEPPVTDPTRQVLYLPYGTQVEIPLIASPGTLFETERLDFRGGADPTLQIATHTDDGRVALATIAPQKKSKVAEFTTTSSDAVFLTLRAESKGQPSLGDGVYFAGPRIRSLVPASPTADAFQSRPNILLYLVDTLRADHLSTYGYDRPTSPRLDAFAESATLFEKAVGQSSWTRPSIASIFTGVWPGAHEVIKRRHALPAEAETLAELLKGAGYASAGFSTNPNISEAFGFSQGFDFFELLPKEYDSAMTNEKVFRWLERRPDDSPFFLYIHTSDPHAPYLPAAPFRAQFAPDAIEVATAIERNPDREIWSGDPDEIRQILSLYDAEIAANDASFGVLLDRLSELDLFDDTVIVFLSDHGEEFLDHGGWTHGRNLFAETLDVPFLIKLPKQRRGQRVSGVVQHVDLLPTLLDLIGAPQPADGEGRSLLPLLVDRGHQSLGARPGYSHVDLVRRLSTSVIVGEWKLISRQNKGTRTLRLFNWPHDLHENNDVASRYPVRTAALTALLDEKLTRQATAPQGEEAELDAELEKRLKALGYL